MALRLRTTTAEEATAVKRVAHSRTEPARRVERARIIWLAMQGERVPAIARAVGWSERTVRVRVKRRRTGVGVLPNVAYTWRMHHLGEPPRTPREQSA